MEALLAVFSILYVFWPLILFFGIRALFRKGNKFSARLRMGMKRVFIAWLVWAFFLGFIYWQGEQPILIMSEWVDHLLFFTMGVLTGSITLGRLMGSWRDRRIKLSDARSLDEILALSPDAFEALISELFIEYGYKTETSGGSSDHGVDILVFNELGEKWVVQCKRYNHSVGEPILRDLYGTMLHEDATRAYLFTTGTFTRQAVLWSEGKPIILYDGEALVNLIRRTEKNKKILSK